MSQQIADETVEMMGFIQNRTAEILWSRFADSAVRQGASIDALRPYHYPFAQDCFDRLVNQPALQRVIENAKSRAKVDELRWAIEKNVINPGSDPYSLLSGAKDFFSQLTDPDIFSAFRNASEELFQHGSDHRDVSLADEAAMERLETWYGLFSDDLPEFKSALCEATVALVKGRKLETVSRPRKPRGRPADPVIHQRRLLVRRHMFSKKDLRNPAKLHALFKDLDQHEIPPIIDQVGKPYFETSWLRFLGKERGGTQFPLVVATLDRDRFSRNKKAK